MTDDLAKYEMLEPSDSALRLTAPIESVTELPDGTLLLHTVVSSERPDNQRGIRDGIRYVGEIIDYDALRKAAPGILEWPSVKEMHDQDTASGTILRLYFDDVLRKAEADLHVVDPVAVKKVLAKVYRAVSIGGLKRAWQMVRQDGQVFRRITDLVWDEISLVDRPANKDAAFGSAFVLAKRDLEEPPMHPADDRTARQLAIDATRGVDEEALAKAEGDDKETDDMAEADVATDSEVVIDDVAGELPAPSAESDEALGADAAEEALAKSDPVPAAAGELGPDVVGAPAASTVASPAPEPLRKSDNVVVGNLQSALSSVTYAIACEAAEGDADDVAALTAIADALQAAIIAEASETPTPAEQLAEVAESLEDAVLVATALDAPAEVLAVSYGRVRAQRALSELEVLAKAGRRNSGADLGRLNRILELAIELGATPPAAAPAAVVADVELPGEPLAKADTELSTDQIAQAVRSVLAEVLPPGKLEAIEQRIVAVDTRSTSQGETLERIAKAEAGGGPANPFSRIYEAAGRGELGPLGAPDRGSVLAAAAEVIDDPRLRSEVGNAAALAQIKTMRGG